MSFESLPQPRLTRRGLLRLAAGAGTLVTLPAHAMPTPRIVSLDYGVATTLMALGIEPVGVADAVDWEVWVVEPKLPDRVIDVGNDLQPNLELLAAMKPDLILTTPYLAASDAALAQIAPVTRITVYVEGPPPLERAIAETARLGTILGREREAEAFLATAEAEFAECRAQLARIAPPPVALVSFVDPRHARVYGAHGLFDDVLQRIGIKNAWQGPSSFWGFHTIALEELAAVPPETRLIAIEPVLPDVEPTLARSPLWNELPFVEAGRVSRVPAVLMFGMVPAALRCARLLTDHLTAVAA